jgi:hypothetical protein
MVVIGAPVLVLDDKLAAVVAFGQDVDAPAARGADLRLANCREIDAQRIAERVELLVEQWREVGRLTPPSFR